MAQERPDLRVTVRLIQVPASVRDSGGVPLDGLDQKDFRLLVDGNPVPFHVETERQPTSLAIVVQNSQASGPVLAKLLSVAGMIQPLIAGEGGRVGLVLFAASVRTALP